jgi:hypothetical protein
MRWYLFDSHWQSSGNDECQKDFSGLLLLRPRSSKGAALAAKGPSSTIVTHHATDGNHYTRRSCLSPKPFGWRTQQIEVFDNRSLYVDVPFGPGSAESATFLPPSRSSRTLDPSSSRTTLSSNRSVAARKNRDWIMT